MARKRLQDVPSLLDASDQAIAAASKSQEGGAVAGVGQTHTPSSTLATELLLPRASSGENPNGSTNQSALDDTGFLGVPARTLSATSANVATPCFPTPDVAKRLSPQQRQHSNSQQQLQQQQPQPQQQGQQGGHMRRMWQSFLGKRRLNSRTRAVEMDAANQNGTIITAGGATAANTQPRGLLPASKGQGDAAGSSPSAKLPARLNRAPQALPSSSRGSPPALVAQSKYRCGHATSRSVHLWRRHRLRTHTQLTHINTHTHTRTHTYDLTLAVP
jgi:hypothetical protein